MKTKTILLSIITISTILFSSCDKSLEDVLSDSEIVEGLKEALKVGTDTATSRLAVTDGYFKDQAVKLLLPDEVENSINTFKSKSISIQGLGEITGEDIYTNGLNIPAIPFVTEGVNIASLSGREDDLVLGINRAAETAAKEAGPIFWDAITDMTIEDGNNILFGGVDTAATAYLNGKTRPGLFGKFEPKIDAALESVKIGDKSVVSTYEKYVTDYNSILNQAVPTSLTETSTIASLMNMNTVGATDLSEYSTNKGLDGLFLKVQGEEAKIRKDPLHRVTDILERVFGELDD